MLDTGPKDLDQLWARALERLDGSLSDAAHRTWLDETVPVGLSDGTVVLAAPHSFAREQLARRHRGALRQALSAILGEPVDVVIIVRPGAGAVDATPASRDGGGERAATAAPASAAAPRAGAPERFPDAPATDLLTKYTFERFVIGPGNRFAHAAAFAVAEAPAKAYNPLFIYGGAGLGKTHLLQAVGHYSARLFPQLQLRYVTTEQFTNEFITAISSGRASAFQRRFRDVDILLIDDIQFLEKRERTQEEFFHTFNDLHDSAKQVVITSDRPPKQLDQLEDRLRTRFEMGLITDIQPPDLETRLAILRKRAQHDRLVVPDDVLELIASRISSNVRELEGALIRVAAAASINKTSIDRTMAEAALKDLLPEDHRAAISVDLIMEETADYFAVTLEDLRSHNRTRQLVTARQIAMYLTRELTELSLPKIGQAFGGRDHTTVMHANAKISALFGERSAIYRQIQELTSRIQGRARGAS